MRRSLYACGCSNEAMDRKLKTCHYFAESRYLFKCDQLVDFPKKETYYSCPACEKKDKEIRAKFLREKKHECIILWRISLAINVKDFWSSQSFLSAVVSAPTCPWYVFKLTLRFPGPIELPIRPHPLKYIAVGRGIQNYSCVIFSSAFLVIGAVANLYDATAILKCHIITHVSSSCYGCYATQPYHIFASTSK